MEAERRFALAALAVLIVGSAVLAAVTPHMQTAANPWRTRYRKWTAERIAELQAHLARLVAQGK